AVSIQGAPQRRPLLSSAPAAGSRSDRAKKPITPSVEQIAPVLTLRLGDNSIAGLFCALAPSLNDRLDRVGNRHDLKAGHGWECRLRVSGKRPNLLVTNKCDVRGAVENLPTAICLCLTAQASVEL